MNRRGIEWQARLTAILATIVLDKVHKIVFGNPENTPIGVTVYLCGAALINLLALFYYASALRGQLSFDLQRLSFCSIALNFFGWLFYLWPIFSPAIINVMVSALTYGMFFRIFWISDNDTDSGGWGDLVRRVIDRSRIIHNEKAQS